MVQSTGSEDPLAPLSERELLVASKSAEGLTYREIADALVIAPNTVRTHLSTIYKKLGIRNKAALIHLIGDSVRDAGEAADSGQPLQAALQPPPSCPYPGMVPFRAEDAVYFYGREAEVEQLLLYLRQQQLLMVIGPSGSGKSSLVYAGLLPQLPHSRYFDQGHWLIRPMRPGFDPIRRLAESLGTAGEDLAVTDDTVRRLLDRHPPARRLLLLVDQFEEIFVQVGHDERGRFITALQTLRDLSNCTLLLTMRADFYPDLMISALWPVEASQRVEIAPLRGAALRQAIEKPASDVGVRLERGLVDRLLADAADEPGVLPLLQETMGQLWLLMENRVLSYSAYEKLCGHGSVSSDSSVTNGLAAAIAMKADATLTTLTANQQLLARRIFLRLIQFGEGRADTRRQQPVSALQAAGDDPKEFDRTLEHLTDHRLLTRSGDDEENDSQVDIAHESLITSWTRLHGWIEQRREAEQVRRRLENKAAEWTRLGQGSGGVLDQAELPEAERWLAGPDAADLGYSATLPELIKTSQQAIAEAEQAREAARQQELRQAEALAEEHRQRLAEQSRAATRMRRSMVGLAAVMLVAVVAGLLAWAQSQQAQKAEQEAKRLAKAEELARTQAETRRVEAEDARLASIAQLLLIQAPQQQAVRADERGALLARQAWRFGATGDQRLQEQADSVLRVVAGKPHFLSVVRQSGTSSVAFSPDGSKMASVHSEPYEVVLWDLTQPGAQPALLQGYPGDADEVLVLALSPDGETLIAANPSGAIGRWRLDDLQTPLDELPRQQGGVWSAAFSPDGRWLATGSKLDDTFVVRDLTQPAAELVLTSDPAPAPTGSGPPAPQLGGVPVAFSPDGTLLATGSLNGVIRLWRPDDLTAPVTSLRGHEGGLLALAFYDQGRHLASSGQDKTIRLWDIESPSAAPTVLQNGSSPAGSLAFDPNGRFLASSSTGDGIKLWQLDELDTPPTALPGFFYRVAFNPNGTQLASAGPAGHNLYLWDFKPNARPRVLVGHQDVVLSVVFSADGKRLASGGGTGDRTIRLWRWGELNTPPVVLRGHKGAVRSLDFHPFNNSLISASWDANSVLFWDIGKTSESTPTFISLPVPDGMKPQTVLFSPNGRTVAVTGIGGAFAWDIDNLNTQPRVLLPTEHYPPGLAFSPSGSTLALGTFGPAIYLKNLTRADSPASELFGHSEIGVWSVAFSPDGKRLASGGRDGAVRLWDPNAPGKASVELGRHDGFTIFVQFSPDGRQLASASADYSVRLWSVDEPDALPIVLSGHEEQVWSLTYSPDGKHLVTGSRDRTIRVWDLTHPLNASATQQVADAVCEKVWRNLTLDEWQKFVGADIPYQRTCENLPVHPSLFEAAEKLSKEGDKKSAAALLERALELDPDLDLHPQQEIARWATPSN